ncbi:MAG: T9SS type A sorting domain-containing protein [Bacteroidota bacterium]
MRSITNSVFTFVLALLFSSTSFAQGVADASPTGNEVSRSVRSNINYVKIDPSHMQEFGNVNIRPETSAARANASFLLDYDSVANHSNAFFWNINSNSTSSGFVTYAAMSFDSLIDLARNPYDYDAHTVSVDSLDLLISLRNGSQQNDTLLITMYPLDQDNNFIDDTIWAGGFITDTSLTSARNSFLRYRTRPAGVTLCSGRFGIKVEFYGPITDTLGLIAGFSTVPTCQAPNGAATCGAAGVSPFYPSGYTGYNASFGFLEFPDSSGNIGIFQDCDMNGMFDISGCELWPIMDWWIWPSVTIRDTLSATLSTTPDMDMMSNGTATVTVSGGTPPYTYVWSSGASVAQATGLAAGPYNVVVADANGCTSSYSVTVLAEDIMSVEDQLNAGLNSFDAYPNPSTGTFTLNLELANADDLTISIMDAQGRLVFTERAEQTSVYTRPISLENASGIYLVQVETSRGQATKKVVINR